MRLLDQVSIITGSGRGLGKGIALSLARHGAKTVILGRTKKEIETTKNEIISSGGKALAIMADVTHVKDVNKAVKKTVQAFGRIDILINNAGIRIRKPVTETTPSEWSQVIKTNLNGAFFFSRQVIPIMVKQSYGRIINISSICGIYGYANLASYCASKFGMRGLTESLALELADKGIKVYAVCPAGIDTAVHRKIYPEHIRSQLLKAEDVVKKIVGLCMPDCKTISGKSIIIKKGWF